MATPIESSLRSRYKSINCTSLNAAPKVGVIIPTFKRGNELICCIDSLRNGSNAAFDIVVINDGGCINVSSLLKDKHPQCIEIKSSSDLWWTKSINVGLEYLIENSYDVAILLNDDVTVSKDYIDNIVNTYIENKSNIIISKIIGKDGNIWSLGGVTDWPFNGPIHVADERYISVQARRRITWSPGMGTLIPIAALSDVGLFDADSFPQYLSDTDFGLRASSKGWNIILNEKCVITNNIDSTGGISHRNPLRWKDLYFIFFDLRSADYLPARTKFTYRHAPRGLRTVSYGVRFLKVLAYFIKRIF